MAVDPAPGPAPPPEHVASARLDALDEAIVGIRRVFQRAGFRRRLLDGLPGEVELATLRLMRVVQRADEPPPVGTVAEVLTVDPSTASRVADRAVAAGLLDRQPCADDRRKARLHLTPTGQALLDEATARRRELLAEVTRAWEPADLDRLVELLGRLQEDFDRFESSA